MSTICIFGLGFVGRDVLELTVRRGYDAVGVDIDEEVVATVEEEQFDSGTESGSYYATTDAAQAVDESDVIVVTVPTPLDSSYSVDLSAVEAVTEMVGDRLVRDDRDTPPLVVLESTVPPGTTNEVVGNTLEDYGLIVGEDVHVAVVPERIDPGRDGRSVESIPRVIGGVTTACRDRAVEFYKELLDAGVHPTDTPEIAESSKIVENAFRDINIAFVNEIAVSLDELGIDAVSTLDAAETKPFGFMRFDPGAGVGGHCIPVDPYLLIESAEQQGFDHRLLTLARDINDRMSEYVVDTTIKALNDAAILPNGSTVLLLGRSFKPGVRDDRNSPYFQIKRQLESYAVETVTHDPEFPDGTVQSPYVSADAAVLITDHEAYDEIDLDRLSENGISVFVDGRNALDPSAVRAAGIDYHGVGR
jgi:nucleotide sugar dehydrogenase